MLVNLDSQQAQEAFGAQLAKRFFHLADQGLVIYLQGDLGAGKTTLVRGMLRGLGWKGAVKSPTYTIMEPYELEQLSLYHFDLYRLASPEELEYLGLRELIGTGVLIFEWPDRGAGGLPAADLVIEIAHLPQGRELLLIAHSEAAKCLLTNFP